MEAKSSYTFEEIGHAIEYWYAPEACNALFLGPRVNELATIYGLMIHYRLDAVDAAKLSERARGAIEAAHRQPAI